MSNKYKTAFSLEDAFKALDEIEIPKTTKRLSNAECLTESLKKTDKFEALFEEYYDVKDTADLEQAQDERDAEVAQAKLAKIEKIVDLDADSPEDIQPSYAGKLIIQCPQCMTLFYKDMADIVPSENDENTVNIGEKCQHCGNEDGYNLVGKVAPVEADEQASFNMDANEVPAEASAEGDLNLDEIPAEVGSEENTENTDEVDFPELDAVEPPEDTDEDKEEDKKEDEEDKKEESFDRFSGNPLNESASDNIDELDKKLKEHNDYINYLQQMIKQEKAALAKATNKEVKDAIQRRIDAFAEDLEAALPDSLKNSTNISNDLPDFDELPDEAIDGEDDTESKPAKKEDKKSGLKESVQSEIDNFINGLSEGCDDSLNEDENKTFGDILPENPSEDDIDALFNSKEFNEPISDSEVQSEYLSDSEELDYESLDEIDDAGIEECITESLTDVYENVNNFTLTSCTTEGKTLVIEGLINFKSGKSKSTKYTFTEAKKNKYNKSKLIGINEDLSKNSKFILKGSLTKKGRCFCAESLEYNYTIGKNLVEGLVKRK